MDPESEAAGWDACPCNAANGTTTARTAATAVQQRRRLNPLRLRRASSNARTRCSKSEVAAMPRAKAAQEARTAALMASREERAEEAPDAPEEIMEAAGEEIAGPEGDREPEIGRAH